LSKSKKQYIEDAISYYKAQRYHEALAAFEQAILIDPNCVKALHGRGVIFASLKQYREAIESYEQASKLAPDVAKIHLDMAETFYAMQDYEKSGSSYREAIRLDSMNVDKYWQKQW
jgi:tetratricopeptide (TPR) repeat protein